MKDFVKELFPPDDSGRPLSPLTRWRLAVFAAFLVIAGHIAWACGWLTSLGLGSGFAQAADVKSMTSEVKEIKIDLLEQRIYDTQRMYCSALRNGTMESQRFYDGQVRKLHREYAKETNLLLPIPDCREIAP